jgi:DNA-binding NarL/FixJ family response regulator
LVAASLGTAKALSERLPADGSNVTFTFETAGRTVVSQLDGPAAPDVLLLDFELLGLSGLKGIHTLVPHLGNCALGVLSHAAPLELARRALAAGANGVIPAAAENGTLISAVTLLAARQRFVLFDVTDSRGTLDRRGSRADMLSERELQVLHGICEGLQNKEIAHGVQVQEVTVKMHVRAIIRKLGARNRTQAAMIARDLGIV